ncbi:MAG TPA: VTT domain-containing protein, partial [Acidiferrobacterales bacterium]|nr:VTT domain-containing protein [Acidiferrobacterales bacterium]
MELIAQLVDIFLHLDNYLGAFLHDYGLWVYALLFAIIFAETGFVVTPFLPGDSLLFVAGTLAAGSGLDVQWLIPLLIAASFGGDNTNYWIGHHLGPRVFRHNNSRLLNHEYLDRTRDFYNRHGGKTILLARFLPILRTFAPFVAGVGRMPYARFLAFSLAGSVLWIMLFVLAGYFFG